MSVDLQSAPLVLIPENPMPRGGAAGWIVTRDGVRLRVVVWSRQSAPKGTVFIFGGRTEFAEKYFEVVGELLTRGFAVATLDWRGQGLSDRGLADPRKGHITDFAGFDLDMAAFMEKIAPDLPKPWIALAHSMGGNILLRAAHDHAEWFSACILSAPMLGLRLGGALAACLKHVIAFSGATFGLATRYVPGGNSRAVDETPFPGNVLTHDERRYAIYQALVRAEPGLGLGASTLGWLEAAFRSIALTASPAYLAAIRTPVLIALAGDDALIDSTALQFAAAHLPRGELVSIRDARHEILIETDARRAKFWAAFDDFINRRLPSESL